MVPYTGYGSTSWIRVLGRVLLTRQEAPRPSAPQAAGIRGWRSFTSVPVDGAVVTVSVGEQRHQVTADRSGLIDEIIPADLEPGWHSIGLSAEEPGPQPSLDRPPQEARVYIVDPNAKLGIVSDVDDTVMVTALPRPLLAAWHAFVLNEHSRRPTPGMPVLYERLARTYPDAPVVYLSTGAWNVAPSLTRFLFRNLYPPGPLLLTDWGTEDSWFRSGTDHKHKSLARLADEFPDMRWLLFGDDGQHDEEIYGEFVRKYPDRVAAVCIRQLSPGQAVLAGSAARSHNRPSDSSVPWLYSPDGAEFADDLERLGILEPSAQSAQPEAKVLE